MSEILTVEDIRRSSGWREVLEENQAYERERHKREIAEQRERQEARKAREAEKQQAVSSDWYAAVDTRVRAHFKDWAWAAIDERIQQWWKVEIEPLKDGIGGALGTIRKQARDELEHAIEEQQRLFEAKLAEQKERHDGRIEASLARERDATGGAQIQLCEEVKRAIAELCDVFGAQLAEQKEYFLSVPGKLPVAKLWQPDSVTYEAQVVCHDGALWQACKDTAQTPGGSDWVCVARAGRDALTPKIRGAYDAHKTYAHLDIIECDGAGYLARRDAPGVPGIPGDGWQLMSRSGRRGPAGERGPQGRKGERGARGEDAPTIVSWMLDQKNYRAIPTLSNGTQGAALELRPLFEQYQLETSDAILS
jgi:hypothetical protein